MKTDRELLELAARVAGIEIDWDSRGAFVVIPGISGSDKTWNPLTDDGDALRLAVKLDIPPSSESVNGTTWVCRGEIQIFQPHEGDPYAATRRAIVRAAAAIGEGVISSQTASQLLEDNYEKTQAEAFYGDKK